MAFSVWKLPVERLIGSVQASRAPRTVAGIMKRVFDFYDKRCKNQDNNNRNNHQNDKSSKHQVRPSVLGTAWDDKEPNDVIPKFIAPKELRPTAHQRMHQVKNARGSNIYVLYSKVAYEAKLAKILEEISNLVDDINLFLDSNVSDTPRHSAANMTLNRNRVYDALVLSITDNTANLKKNFKDNASFEGLRIKIANDEIKNNVPASETITAYLQNIKEFINKGGTFSANPTESVNDVSSKDDFSGRIDKLLGDVAVLGRLEQRQYCKHFRTIAEPVEMQI